MDKQTVYIVKFSDGVEYFYKIGITSRFTSRLSNIKKLYPIWDVVLYKNFENSNEALNAENELHEINKKFRYLPSKKFGGYLECYNNLNKNKCHEILSA